MTAKFDISSWSDSKLNVIKLGSVWLLADCKYAGDAVSGCKRSYLYTDSTIAKTTTCSITNYISPTFPTCKSCNNGATSCTNDNVFKCRVDNRIDATCTKCHYACATC